MNEHNDIQDANMEAARRIDSEILGDPNSPYIGKWVGIARGQVVAAGDYDEVSARLEEIEPDPSQRLVMEGVAGGELGVLATYGEWLCPERGRGCPLTPPPGPFAHAPTEESSTTLPNDVYEINSELARKINHEARRDPKSSYAGKFVGIANGRVVVVADSWDDLARRLRAIEPDPMRTFCVEASADYDSVYEV